MQIDGIAAFFGALGLFALYLVAVVNGGRLVEDVVRRRNMRGAAGGKPRDGRS